MLCSSQFAASPFVTILGCFVSFPLSYFVSAYLSSDSIMHKCKPSLRNLQFEMHILQLIIHLLKN